MDLDVLGWISRGDMLLYILGIVDMKKNVIGLATD